MVATCMLPTRDLACNPGMCPDWESNQRPFVLQASAQSTEPHQPGPEFSIYKIISCANNDDLLLSLLFGYLFISLSCLVALPRTSSTILFYFIFYSLTYFIFFNFYCYSITVVCIFSPSLHPTPAKPTSLPCLHPPP